MNREAVFFILVAGERRATIYANSAGETRVVRLLDRVKGPGIMHSSRHQFACQVAMVLARAARHYRPKGLAIIAGMSMAQHVLTVITPELRRLIMADVDEPAIA